MIGFKTKIGSGNEVVLIESVFGYLVHTPAQFIQCCLQDEKPSVLSIRNT